MKEGIFEIPNFLSDEKCDRIVSYCKAKVNALDRLNGYRDAHGTWLYKDHDLDMLDIIEELTTYISKETELDIENQENLHVIKYLPGGEYKNHWDYFHEGDERIESQGGNRVYSFLFYLNDNFTGGETFFPQFNRTVVPEKGKLLFWNNLNPDGSRKHNSEHAGLPVKEGEKWIMTSWVRERYFTK